jgi:hypothetical protein
VVAPQRRPAAEPLPIYDPETGEVDEVQPYMIPLEQTNGKSDWIRWGGILVKQLQACDTLAEGEEWIAQQELTLAKCENEMPKIYERIQAQIKIMRLRLAEFITPA